MIIDATYYASSTIHKTEARFVSGLGWGLKKRIEEYSASRFKANIEKVLSFFCFDITSYSLSVSTRPGTRRPSSP